MSRSSTDWAAVRLAYINSTKTLREVAAEFEIGAPGVMRRAAREKWDAERKRLSSEVSKAAQKKLTIDRAAELARINDEDLKIATTLKAKAYKMAQDVDNPADLRTLTSVFESAQRISHAALAMIPEDGDADVAPIKVLIERRSARKSDAVPE